MIVGRSVHNQHVERLWRDVYCGVLSLYYELFTYMEMEGILDYTNEGHLHCLHYPKQVKQEIPPSKPVRMKQMSPSFM